MEQLPLYIPLTFIVTTILTLFLFYKASSYSRKAILILSAWLIIQLAISLSDFYTITDAMPPRFLLLVLPPVLLIAGLFFTERGMKFIDRLNLNTLTLLHIVRIPVEWILLLLYLQGLVPREMTFDGWNFDILSGITAPLVYLAFTKNLIGRRMLLAWNIICLILLIIIVSTAVLSAPFPFQQIAFKQPNIAVLYFPFTWLPGFIVPTVMFCHLVSIRKLTSR
ncbi:MAG: hypothetical protein H7069_12485 [Phormidesmis sp. FL-bin-119]|nr:hypothetical protein [Pedobacter sp.]